MKTLNSSFVKNWKSKIEGQKHTAELFNNMFPGSFIPTINNPKHITHSTTTLIDNIYVKFIDLHTI